MLDITSDMEELEHLKHSQSSQTRLHTLYLAQLSLLALSVAPSTLFIAPTALATDHVKVHKMQNIYSNNYF